MPAAAVLVGVLAVVGWRADWPSAVFGARQQVAFSQTRQVGTSQTGTRQVGTSRPGDPGSGRHQPGRASPSPAPAPTSSQAQPPGSTPVTTPTESPGTAGAGGAPTGTAAGPAAVVRGYFAAITAKRYADAWKLGGVNTGMGSYDAFVAGFTTTASDKVTILAVNGDVVTARLVATQTDGSAKTFQGTYTVETGAIVRFDVQQIS